MDRIAKGLLWVSSLWSGFLTAAWLYAVGQFVMLLVAVHWDWRILDHGTTRFVGSLPFAVAMEMTPVLLLCLVVWVYPRAVTGTLGHIAAALNLANLLLCATVLCLVWRMH